jgi:MFS family permease
VSSPPAPEPRAPEPPTRLLTPAFVALFVAALTFFASGSIVLPVATRYVVGPLGADATGVGIAIGAFAIAALVMRPVVGWASDRYGRRPLLLLGGVITVAALAMHLAASTLPLFVVARSLLGIGEAFFFVAAVAAISDLAPPDRQGEAINVGSLALYLGLAVGPFIGETVLSIAGFAAVWLVAGGTALVATALSALVPETAPAVVEPRAGPRPRSRLIHPAGIFPGILIMSGAWGMAGFLAFIPLHASGVGLDGAGLPLAIYAGLVMVLRIVFVRAPDQIGAARLSGAALAVGAVGLAMIGLLQSPIGLLVGTAVFAAGIAFMFPALVAVAVARVDETERGSVVGTTTVFLDVAFGLAPAALGAVAAASGYPAVFLSSAVVAAVGSALLYARRDSVAAEPTLAP